MLLEPKLGMFNTSNIIWVLLFLSGMQSAKSQNLIPNPSFEIYTKCPVLSGNLEYAVPWVNATMSTPDLFNKCAGDSCNSNTAHGCVPTNWQGSQVPHSGEGYAGFFVYETEYRDTREYIQVRLASPLIPGKEYKLSFYVSLSDISTYAIKNIGAVVTDTKINRTDLSVFKGFSPQVESDSVIRNQEEWTLISGCFIANGGEEYLTIGNFETDSSTTRVSVSTNIRGHVYYYLDDVSLVEYNEDFDLGNDTILCPGEVLLLEVEDSVSTFTWHNGSNQSHFLIDSPGEYWVQSVNGCRWMADTINIQYYDDFVLDLGNDTIVCDGDSIVFDLSFKDAEYYWNDGSVESSFEISQSGTYWVIVSNQCSIQRDSILIESIYCDPIVTMPNIFTPNNDGVNDYFVPVEITHVEEINLVIFNRWGKMVYETNDVEFGWDGRSNEGDCSDGVYYWILNYRSRNNLQGIIKGHLTLLRNHR